MSPELVGKLVISLGIILVIILISVYVWLREIQKRLDHDDEVKRRLNEQKRHKK